MGPLHAPRHFSWKAHKSLLRLSDSLVPCLRGSNNDSIWSFPNASATKENSSEHLDTSHHITILSLKKFSHRPPRRQSPKSDWPRQLSPNGTRSYLL
ncbi:hypothetical protein TNCV_674951 [Trichonephila clavipes]|nr:hypothetical protein TNCV_674951 [Trichonephila clavipes]